MRESDGYREQLERLVEKFPDKEVLSMKEVQKMMHCQSRTLLADKSFPAKRIGSRGKYVIPIVSLARWLAKC